MTTSSLAALELLLKAPEKAFVEQIFVFAFSARKSGSVPDAIKEKACTAMEITADDADGLFSAASALIDRVLFENVSSSGELKGLLPASMHAKLKSLITSIIASHLASWRETAANEQLSLPRLKSFDWRVDVKTASDTLSRVSIPTAVISMQVEGQSSSLSSIPADEQVCFEATKETLDTMLDGLSKIRDQLASVTADS